MRPAYPRRAAGSSAGSTGAGGRGGVRAVASGRWAVVSITVLPSFKTSDLGRRSEATDVHTRTAHCPLTTVLYFTRTHGLRPTSHISGSRKARQLLARRTKS